MFLFFFGSAFAQSHEDQVSFSLERKGFATIVVLHSIKKFPCRNYQFDLRDYQNEDTTILVIRDFLAPINCTGPRDVAVDKYTVTPSSKLFFLQLRYKGKRDMWRIIREDSSYLVKPERASFSKYND